MKKERLQPKNIQKGLRRKRRKRKMPIAHLAPFFAIGVLCATILFWGIMFITRSANIDAYFVTDHTNSHMDYFNMLATIHSGNPYYAYANYPALCFVFWKVMHRFFPVPYVEGVTDGFYLRGYMIAQLGYILYLVVCLVIIWEILKWCVKGDALTKILFGAAILFSGPMFFLLERGNILLAALACLLLFLALYDSPKKGVRIFSYFCLAIAAALKIYPAVFGILVLYKKRYKETLLLIALGIIFFFGPFFVFDGIDSLKTMIEGYSVATNTQLGQGLGSNYSADNLIKLIFALCGVNLMSTSKWLLAGVIMFCVSLLFLSNKEWQRLYALSLLCIWTPSFSYTYSLVVFFLPILSFFFRQENNLRQRFRWGYAILFGLIVIPYALPMIDRINALTELEKVRFPVSWGTLITNGAIIIVAALIIIERTVDIWQCRLGAKRENIRRNKFETNK